MNFNLTNEQSTLVEKARNFASSTLKKKENTSESLGFDQSWQRSCEQNYVALTMPRKYGGQGMSLFDSVLVFEAMAEAGADPGFLLSLGVHQYAVAGPMMSLGTVEQQEAWMSAMARGDCIGALAITEPEAGSDTFATSTTALETEDGFIINGEKVWITNAPKAGMIVISARTDDKPGPFGLSCFILKNDAKGLTITPHPLKTGLSDSPWGSLKFENVKVGKDAMLGTRGGALAIFKEAMTWERVGLFSIPLGLMQHAFKDCVNHVKRRKQFKKQLIKNAVVAHSIAQIKMRIEASRLLLYKAAMSVSEGVQDDMSISLAKIFVSEAALKNALDMQKLYGALGVLHDNPAAKLANDVMPFRILSGANDVHSQIVARLIGVQKV